MDLPSEFQRRSKPTSMEAILVKIFATALALSQVTTTPDAVKTQFDRTRDQEEVAQLLSAGCTHMRKAFDIEDINLDELIATAMDDPQAMTIENKAFRGINFADLQTAYRQFCKNEKVPVPAVDLGEVIDHYNKAVADLPDHNKLKGLNLPDASVVLDRRRLLISHPYSAVSITNDLRNGSQKAVAPPGCACRGEPRSLGPLPASAQPASESRIAGYNLWLSGAGVASAGMTRKRGPADDIQRRDAGNGGKCHLHVLFFRIVRLQCSCERGHIERITPDTSPYPWRRLVRRENPNSGGDFAQAIRLHELLVSFHAEAARQNTRRQHFGQPEPDREPSQSSCHRMSVFSGVHVHRPVPRHGLFSFHGLRTTFTQPSSLSRKVLYMPGPSSKPTRWVTTNDGSI